MLPVLHFWPVGHGTMNLFKSLKSSWYFGKGYKALKNQRYDQALRYFLFALKYNQAAENSAELAVLKEALAETYLKLENFDEARLYATESIEIYETFYSKDKSDLFGKSVYRANKLLEKISERKMNC